MNITLTRIGYLPNVTLGQLNVAGTLFSTLEDPWRPNPDGPGGMHGSSCVPDGVYQLYPHESVKFGRVFGLSNPAIGVWPLLPAGQIGRDAVLIHFGNSTQDVEGCLLIGTSAGILNNQHWIYDSRAALTSFMALMGPGNHTLTIRPSQGTHEQT